MPSALTPGIDAGSPQGDITPAQWAAIYGQPHLFAMLRVIEGVGPGLDATFAPNRTNARAAGFTIGAYCVFVPGDDPAAQAQAWFVASGGLGFVSGELPPTIDFETASKTITPAQECAALVATIQAVLVLWGRLPMIYSYPDFEAREILAVATPDELALIAKCPLWYASYQATPPAPPKPWAAVTFWQQSGGQKYHLPGPGPTAGAPCDVDYFLGTPDELAAFAQITPAAPR